MLDKELMEQFQLLATMIERSEQNMSERIDESRRHTEILIENTVAKRIDALFDGYSSP